MSWNRLSGDYLSSNKREPAVCEYLFSVRRYPDWAHTWGKDTTTKPQWQQGIWATWHIACLSLGLFQSVSKSFAIVHRHVYACGTRCLGPPACMGLKFFYWKTHSMNFKELLPAVNHTAWRHVRLTESIIYSFSCVWGIDSSIGHMCQTVMAEIHPQTHQPRAKVMHNSAAEAINR